MAFLLPRIYPITDRFITKLSHLEQVQQLVKAGAKMIQLRDKHSTPREFYESARAVMNFTRETDVRIIINDRVDIALAVKADGVHLGQDDLHPADAREILGSGSIIGFSTHNVAEAIEAVGFPLDYIAIGPIFATSTKENPEATVGLDGLASVRREIGQFPLVAIGGIEFENAKLALSAGATSVAVISSILRNPAEICRNTHKFVEQL